MKHVLLLSCLLWTASATMAQGGLLNKIKNKANDALNKKVDKKLGIENEGSGGATGNGAGNSGPGGKPRNTKGGGLVVEPPDVNLNLDEASQKFKSSQFPDSRRALQQAIMGVELQIGREILKTLPEKILDLDKIADKDVVASNGWGWQGLVITREYQKEDKHLTVGIADASWWGGAYAYLAMNTQYEGANSEQVKHKKIRVSNTDGIILYDEREGYTVMLQMQQGSQLLFKGVNFNDEKEMMKAVESVDIEAIKKWMGDK